MRRQQVYSSIGTILAVVVLFGLILWWPPGAPPSSSNQLGAALLGSTIVALAVLVAEFLVNAQTREIDERYSLAAQ